MTTATRKKATKTVNTPKPAKAQKAPKVSASKKAAMLSGKIKELREQRRIFNSSCLEWDEAHAHAAELKKTMEKNQARLNSIAADIDAIESGNYTPSLFDDKPGKKGKGKAANNGEANGTAESWRAFPLKDLKLSKPIVAALDDAKITTMGQLADYSKRNRLTDIKGIGEAAAETIENATTEYWRKNPLPDPEPSKPTLFDKTPEEAIKLCDRIIDAASTLPEAGLEFGEGVVATAKGIKDWIVEKKHVTADQQVALKNMADALERWDRK